MVNPNLTKIFVMNSTFIDYKKSSLVYIATVLMNKTMINKISVQFRFIHRLKT